MSGTPISRPLAKPRSRSETAARRVATGSERTVLGAVLVVATFAKFAYCYHYLVVRALQPWSDFNNIDSIAVNLLGGIGWFDDITNLGSARMPVTPLFEAGVYAVFGHSLFALGVIQSLIWTAVAWLTFRLADGVAGRSVAWIALVVTLFHPDTIVFAGLNAVETLAALWLMLIVSRVAVTPWWGMRRRDAVLVGLLSALSLLTVPTTIFYLILLGTVELWSAGHAGQVRAACTNAAAAGAVVVLIFTPWVARNYYVFHRFVPFSLEGGENIYGANNPLARGEVDNEFLVRDAHSYGVSTAEYSAIATRKAVDFIRHHPGAWLRLEGMKFAKIWTVKVPSLYQGRFLGRIPELVAAPVTWALLNLLLIAGTLYAQRSRAYLHVLLPIAGYVLFVLVFFSYPRYRVPYLSYYTLAAAYGATVGLGFLLDDVKRRIWLRPAIALGWVAVMVGGWIWILQENFEKIRGAL